MVWAANSSLTGADVKRIVCESGKKAAECSFTFGIPKQINPDPANKRAYFVNAATAVDMSLHSFNVWAEEYEPETDPENGAILCWVVDKKHEDIKLEGAAIEAVDENDKTKVYKTTSDEFGHFELILPHGTYTLKVRHDHYEDYVKTGVEVTDEGVNYLDDWIKMKPFTGKPVYGITGAEWVVDPTIKADDIIVGDRFTGFPAFVSCPYVYIRRDGKYGLIGYDGNIAVQPEYDSFNGNGFYGLDDFIAVYDSKSGDTIFAQNNDTSGKGKWKIVNVEKAFGQPGIGSATMTYFINENDRELYRFYTLSEKPAEITDGPDISYIVQKINYVVSGYGIGKSSAADDRFFLYNDLKGEMVTDGYKYVCTNGDGNCTYSGSVGNRVMTDGYKTAAFSNDMKKWDIYDALGVLIAKDLEPFDCNLDLTTSWAPATSFFDDADNYDSAKNTHGKAVPFCATEGYIAAKKDGKCGYLDLDGNEVIAFGILEDVRPVHDGKAWAKFEGKWGVLSFETMS